MKRFILMPLIASLLLGMCLSSLVKAQQKSKTVSAKQLRVWINQLGVGNFQQRRAASNNLSKAGKEALPALVKGAHRNDAEVAKRCFDIITTMYQGKNEPLISAAEKTLDELEKSSNRSVAYRANFVIQKKMLEAYYAIRRLGGDVSCDDTGRVRIVKFFSHTTVMDAGLAHLRGMTRLRCLTLENAKITDAGLMHLRGLTNLQELTLRSPKITDTGLVHLKGLIHLRRLLLADTHVTDAGVVHLKEMDALHTLLLESTMVTGSGLVHLKGMTSLRKLSLENSKVTDENLVHLKGMPYLETLWLNKTQVSDAGLVHLNGITSLKLVILRNTKVTAAGVKELRAALPKCKISWK